MWPCWELSPLGSVPCAGRSAGALCGKRPGRHVTVAREGRGLITATLQVGHVGQRSCPHS